MAVQVAVCPVVVVVVVPSFVDSWACTVDLHVAVEDKKAVFVVVVADSSSRRESVLDRNYLEVYV